MIEASLTSEQMSKASSQDLATKFDPNAKDIIEDLNSSNNNEKTTGSYRKVIHSMTEAEIVGNAVLFFEAGYETTSTALGFISHMLVNHIGVQDRVREEAQQLFEREGKLHYNTVSQLTFMEAVIYETMRIFPPLTLFVTRTCVADFKYKDITIPAGANITVPVYQLHHDARYWQEPEKFDPERFMGTNKGKVNLTAFQPFGNGPRNCIGMRFALLEIKLALARLLTKYRLEAGPTTEIGSLQLKYKPIGINPTKGIFVKAVPI
jgi:cytochrome P450